MQARLSFRRYLLQQIAGAVVINSVMTIALTWWLTQHGKVPVWGEKGLVVETLVAAIGVALFTVLLATPVVRREAKRGKVEPLSWTTTSHALLRYASHHTWWRAAVFSLAAATFLAAPVIVAWVLVGPNEVSYATFFTYKVLFVLAVGSIVTPLNIIWVLTDRRSHGAAARFGAA
ncbi:MAG: hypothetical protein NTZ90_12290 [Proteobacteria bacterium]|nr:hypothetical protein [Pseudomonadota bacterium]